MGVNVNGIRQAAPGKRLKGIPLQNGYTEGELSGISEKPLRSPEKPIWVTVALPEFCTISIWGVEFEPTEMAPKLIELVEILTLPKGFTPRAERERWASVFSAPVEKVTENAAE